MKLFYRGASYETHPLKLEADGVETIGTYRGAPATRKHFHVDAGRHNRVEMTYRGVKYTQSV
jgi:hypothetical protein